MTFKTFVYWLICVAVFVSVGYYLLENPDVSFMTSEHTGFHYFRVLSHELRMDGLLTLNAQNGGDKITLLGIEVDDGSGWREVDWLTPGSQSKVYDPYEDMQFVVKTNIRGEYMKAYSFKLKIKYKTQIEHEDASQFTGRLAALRG